jgi:cysteinyl-tRNA synthetase
LDEIPAEVMALAERRLEARRGRDFAEADRLRDEIKGMGYTLEDTKDGTKVVRS